MMKVQTTVLLVPALVLAACATGAFTPSTPSTPRPRDRPRAEPRPARKTPVSPLAFSDSIARLMAEFHKASEAWVNTLLSAFRKHPKPPSLDDALASISTLRKVVRDQGRAYAALVRPATPAGRELARRFEAYRKNVRQELLLIPGGIRLLYSANQTQPQRIKRFMVWARKLIDSERRFEQAVKVARCRYVKSHGVQETDHRYASCRVGDRYWLKKAQAIEKQACACKDLQCAKNQQKAIDDYIQQTEGVTVEKEIAKQVAKAMVKAVSCVTKITLAHKIRQIRRPRPRPRPRP